MITNTVGIFGPVLAGFLCNWKLLGRRYTMVIGALVSMAFFFAYTAVRTPAQNIAFTCMIYFWVNVYYGTLCKHPRPPYLLGSFARIYADTI
jgi:sugar phosphate permease